MPWMSKYLRCLSVRIGVVLIGAASLITFLVLGVMLYIYDMKVFDLLLQLLESDAEIPDDTLLGKLIQLKNNSILWLQGYMAIHALANLLGLYAALELQKHFLWPMMLFEFVRILFSIALNILLMPVVNKLLSLTLAIIYESIGYFLILFLGYNWAACVSFYQILVLIKSERYRSLYGNDPLRPILRQPPSSLPEFERKPNFEAQAAAVRRVPISYDNFYYSTKYPFNKVSLAEIRPSERLVIRWPSLIDEQSHLLPLRKY